MSVERKKSTLLLMRKVERELNKPKYSSGQWTIGDVARAINERFTLVAPVIRSLGWRTVWSREK